MRAHGYGIVEIIVLVVSCPHLHRWTCVTRTSDSVPHGRKYFRQICWRILAYHSIADSSCRVEKNNTKAEDRDGNRGSLARVTPSPCQKRPPKVTFPTVAWVEVIHTPIAHPRSKYLPHATCKCGFRLNSRDTQCCVFFNHFMPVTSFGGSHLGRFPVGQG